MPKKYLNPYTDFGFKKLFGEEASKELLIDFLNQLLPKHHQIAGLSFKNPERLANTAKQRKAIFDIYCQTAKGERFIVEMQKAKVKYFKDRALFYSTFPIRDQGKKGEWNFALLPIYFVAILDFRYDEEEEKRKFLRDVCLRDQDGDVFFDKLHFKFLQMPLFTLQEHELSTHFDKWVYFLKNLEHFDHIPAILNEPIFQKGFEIAELSHLTPHQLDSYQRSLIEYAEVRNVSDTSFEEGLVKGEQIGIEKGEKIGIEKGEKIGIEKGEKIGLEKGAQNTKLAIAKALKDQQVPIDIIEATTGLTEQEIKTL